MLYALYQDNLLVHPKVRCQVSQGGAYQEESLFSVLLKALLHLCPDRDQVIQVLSQLPLPWHRSYKNRDL